MGINKLTKSDRILTFIMIGFGLGIAYNIWADKVFELITNLIN